MYIGLRVKYPLFLSDFLRNLHFHDRFSKIRQISNFMTLRPVGAEFFHADRQTDGHDEVNSRFSQFLRTRQKGAHKKVEVLHAVKQP